ncbi:M28 family peptidase, partial [bacterium]|nr:M28 family peptidase [bacterium]
VGYGIDRPDKGRDDYGDLDLRGRAVVIVRKEFNDQAWDFSLDYPRHKLVPWALKRGAAAILFYQEGRTICGAAVDENIYEPQVPMFYIGDRILDLLLRDTGFTQKTYLASLKEAPNPMDLHKPLWISARVPKVAANSAQNVMGFIYGTDKELSGEIVAIGAHWDHIGSNCQGLIYNGADDDASGCGLVMELARTMAQKKSLKRSLMVIFFTGEEDGLLGSKYFVNHPTVPLGRIVAMLNFDMVGQGDGTVGMAGGELLGTAWESYKNRLSDEEKDSLHLYRSSLHWSSDAAPFLKAGVPTMGFWSSGDHPFYHQYEDDAQYIKRDVIQNVGQRAENFLSYLLNDCPPLLNYSDSLRILVRMSPRIDWEGMSLAEAPMRLSWLPSGIHLVWLPQDNMALTWMLLEEITRLRLSCEDKEIFCGNLPDALNADRKQQRAIVFAVKAQTLAGHSQEEIDILFRQGIGLIDLEPTRTFAQLNTEVISTARDAGAFALMPIDHSTAGRIQKWKDHAIVRASLHDLSQVPPMVRDSLLESPAILLLTIDETLEANEIEIIRPYLERKICLIPSLNAREAQKARALVSSLFKAGLTSDEIVLALNGNIRRLLR